MRNIFFQKIDIKIEYYNTVNNTNTNKPMLFYIRCPSCGTVISYKKDEYDKECEQIKNICCRIRVLGEIPYHKIIV